MPRDDIPRGFVTGPIGGVSSGLPGISPAVHWSYYWFSSWDGTSTSHRSRVGSLAVGGVARFSSGLLGIGDGLAIPVWNYPNTRLS
jgi:hypothetical protein